jgi:hypothetical protein
LLDEEQIEVVEFLQSPPVRHRVGGVGIDLQQHVGKAVAQRARARLKRSSGWDTDS